jgi:hypothetical protein
MPVIDTAMNLTAARLAAVRGDQEGSRRAMEAVAEDLRRSMRVADTARAVDREAARSAARKVSGVRSIVWLDANNLFAIVDRNERRSYETIDSICLELEPLGDTLGVVVNLQSGAAKTGDELEILSRNCQLAPGEHALMQPQRKVDVIDPEIRAQHKRNNGRIP